MSDAQPTKEKQFDDLIRETVEFARRQGVYTAVLGTLESMYAASIATRDARIQQLETDNEVLRQVAIFNANTIKEMQRANS